MQCVVEKRLKSAKSSLKAFFITRIALWKFSVRYNQEKNYKLMKKLAAAFDRRLKCENCCS